MRSAANCPPRKSRATVTNDERKAFLLGNIWERFANDCDHHKDGSKEQRNGDGETYASHAVDSSSRSSLGVTSRLHSESGFAAQSLESPGYVNYHLGTDGARWCPTQYARVPTWPESLCPVPLVGCLYVLHRSGKVFPAEDVWKRTVGGI